MRSPKNRFVRKESFSVSSLFLSASGQAAHDEVLAAETPIRWPVDLTATFVRVADRGEREAATAAAMPAVLRT